MKTNMPLENKKSRYSDREPQHRPTSNKGDLIAKGKERGRVKEGLQKKDPGRERQR